MLGSKISPRWKKGFALGAVSLVAVTALRSAAQPLMGAQATLLFFTIPVLISAYYGGLVPGLAATAASGVLGVALFVVPYQTSWRVESIRVVVFLSQGVLVSVLTEELHRARSRAERTAEDLLASDDRFRLLMDATHDYALYGLDESGRVNSWNAGAERLTGYPESEILGQPFASLYWPEDRDAGVPDDVLRRAAEDGACRTPGRRVRRDGSRYWADVSVTALRDPATCALLGYAVVSHDITDQRQRDLAIRDHLARTRAILDAANDAILTFDPDGQIESANPAAASIFGHTSEILATLDARSLLSLPESGPLTADAIRAYLVHDDVQATGRRADGSTFPAEISASDMELAGRRLCACFVKDVTRRKAAEDQLRQLNERLEQRVSERTRQLQEVNEELKAFTYTISHDLRSPLRSMQRFSQLLLSEDPDVTPEAKGEAARRTLASSTRMDRLIQDLLEYSRLTHQEFRPQRVSLILVVQEVLGQLERDPQYAARRPQINVREPLPVVLGHRAILLRILLNLLTNAIKFVADGQTPWVQVWTEHRGDRVRLFVQDNGVGIPPESHHALFEPFAGADGHDDDSPVTGGLGLAVVRKGVERLGGHLGLQSEPGKGSTFWVDLPKG